MLSQGCRPNLHIDQQFLKPQASEMGFHLVVAQHGVEPAELLLQLPALDILPRLIILVLV